LITEERRGKGRWNSRCSAGGEGTEGNDGVREKEREGSGREGKGIPLRMKILTTAVPGLWYSTRGIIRHRLDTLNGARNDLLKGDGATVVEIYVSLRKNKTK